MNNTMNQFSRQITVRAVLLEGVLIVLAAGWAWWQEIPWQTALTPTFASCLAGFAGGFGLLAVNYILLEYGSRYSTFFRILKQLIEEDVSPLFRHVDAGGVFIIALISGFAEEVLFRGVLQAQFGLWISSVVFGLAHIWRKTAILYGMYASGIGLILGSMYQVSGNLWVPILAHIVNNFVAILYYIHYILQPEPPHVEKQSVS